MIFRAISLNPACNVVVEFWKEEFSEHPSTTPIVTYTGFRESTTIPSFNTLAAFSNMGESRCCAS